MNGPIKIALERDFLMYTDGFLTSGAPPTMLTQVLLELVEGLPKSARWLCNLRWKPFSDSSAHVTVCIPASLTFYFCVLMTPCFFHIPTSTHYRISVYLVAFVISHRLSVNCLSFFRSQLKPFLFLKI